MELSCSFTREEFLCKCGDCDYDTVDAELVTLLQELRDSFNEPIIITSGNRCPAHNLAIGSKAKNSYHIRGRAADIQVRNISPAAVQEYIRDKYPEKYGLGCYATFTHIDTRTKKGRWNG